MREDCDAGAGKNRVRVGRWAAAGMLTALVVLGLCAYALIILHVYRLYGNMRSLEEEITSLKLRFNVSDNEMYNQKHILSRHKRMQNYREVYNFLVRQKSTTKQAMNQLNGLYVSARAQTTTQTTPTTASSQVEPLRQAAKTSDNCMPGPPGQNGISIQGPQGPRGPPGPPGTSISEEDVQIAVQTIMMTSQGGLRGLFGDVTTNASFSTTYIRWGRTECPSGAEVVYHGIAAGSSHSHKGGGANYQCLPNDPQWGKYEDGFQSNSFIYGAEYQIYANNPFLFYDQNSVRMHDHDVPCALCRVTSRSSTVMIPAHNQCPSGWRKEYNGYLMSEHIMHQRSAFVCMDESPEVRPAGQDNRNGALFYNVEAVCGSLSCPNYVNGRELTCAVCSI